MHVRHPSRFRSLAAIGLLACLSLASSANAQVRPIHSPPMLTSESCAHHTKMSPEAVFQKMDADHNGELSQSEWMSGRQEKRVERKSCHQHKKMCDSKNSSCTKHKLDHKKKEKILGPYAMFHRLDVDNSGLVSLNEWVLARDQLKDQRRLRIRNKKYHTAA